LIDRKIGSDQAVFYHNKISEMMTLTLREPEKLALTKYLNFDDDCEEATEVDRLLRFLHSYHVRSADLYGLKKRGSESSHQTYVWDRCQNLWSVLRNLHDRRQFDERYDTVVQYMREAFPSFQDLLIESTGPETVYGNFAEVGRREPIKASGVSDGHLQMLAHLTCLFSEGKNRPSTIIFDEPEISLHPYALAVFARAVGEAADYWNKQVFIATHSPVLISQFQPEDIIATEVAADGRTVMRRVSEIPDIQDLLNQYAAGSLYMSEAIAAQSTGARTRDTRDLAQVGFRWPSRTTASLPNGTEMTIEPSTYLSSRERPDLTDRQRKFLKLYRVTMPDGTVLADLPEIEVERLLGGNGD